MRPIVKGTNSRPRQVEEKTLLSVFMGLRKKFARGNPSEKVTYKELHTMFTQIMKNINPIQLEKFARKTDLNEKLTLTGDVIVDDAIKKSKIKRYPWKQILGTTLTKIIWEYWNEGIEVEKAYLEIRKDKRILEFISANEHQKDKILYNLKDSFHSRYAELNSAKKNKDNNHLSSQDNRKNQVFNSTNQDKIPGSAENTKIKTTTNKK